MSEYTVTWEIQVDAASPRDAAVIARDLQRDTKADVGTFDVTDEDGKITRIDLGEPV